MSSIDTQHEMMILLLIALHTLSLKSVMGKKLRRYDRLADETKYDDSWSTNYMNDWRHDHGNGEVRQITIERKIPVPVFVEKIRHVPMPITKPIFIDRPIPIVHILPRSQNYHHHHFTEYHHMY